MFTCNELLSVIKQLKVGSYYYFLDMNNPDVNKRSVTGFKVISKNEKGDCFSIIIDNVLNNKDYKISFKKNHIPSKFERNSLIHLLTNKTHYGKIYYDYEQAVVDFKYKNKIYLHKLKQKLDSKFIRNHKELLKIQQKQQDVFNMSSKYNNLWYY